MCIRDSTSMRAKVSSTHRGSIPRWRLLGWEGLILGVVSAWLFTSCVSMQAEDPKPDEHPQTAAVQQNAPTKDSKKKIANAAVSATCKIKSDDSAVVTNPGEVASPVESDGQEQISKARSRGCSYPFSPIFTRFSSPWQENILSLIHI